MSELRMEIVGMPLHLWLLMLHGGHALHAEIRRLRSTKELAESLEVRLVLTQSEPC